MDSHGLGMDSARNLPLFPSPSSSLCGRREETIGVGVVGVVFPSPPNNGRFSSTLGKAGQGWARARARVRARAKHTRPYV